MIALAGPPLTGPREPTLAPPRPPSTVERLRDPMPTDRVVGWLVTVGLCAVACVLRVVDLGYPNKLVFDETYYAKDAYSLLRFGYERSWPTDANASVTSGNVDVMLQTPAFIVHPPVGKWLIAAGEWAFGMNSFGWRVGPLVFGVLLVGVTIRLTRRVARSTLVGGIAGLLMTLDGLAFVLSRTALLDVFLAFFVAAAVACLVADRDWMRERLARHLDAHGLSDLGGRYGPALLLRPWRIAAGVAFGLALGTKWSALYLLAAFALLSLAWDVGARRLAGAGWRSLTAVLRDGLPAVVSLVVLGLVVYVSTWVGWLATSGGYDRDWAARHPDATSTRLLGDAFASLLQYHRDIYAFHTGTFINNATHAYAADPAGWLVLARPIGIDAVNDIAPGTGGCLGPDNCIRVISGIGTPAIWWAAVVALLAAVLLWVGGRDWRFGVPVVGVLAGWLPWFAYDTRPLFFFYAIVCLPFSVLALSLGLGLVLGPRDGRDRRTAGAVVVGAFLALVAASFGYLYPVLTDQLLPYPAWLSRMWFRSWI